MCVSGIVRMLTAFVIGCACAELEQVQLQNELLDKMAEEDTRKDGVTRVSLKRGGGWVHDL